MRTAYYLAAMTSGLGVGLFYSPLNSHWVLIINYLMLSSGYVKLIKLHTQLTDKILIRLKVPLTPIAPCCYTALDFMCGFVQILVLRNSSISGANRIPGMSNIESSEKTGNSVSNT